MASVFKEEQPWVRAESREGLGAATETKGRMKGSECVNNFFHLNANLSLKKKYQRQYNGFTEKKDLSWN